MNSYLNMKEVIGVQNSEIFAQPLDPDIGILLVAQFSDAGTGIRLFPVFDAVRAEEEARNRRMEIVRAISAFFSAPYWIIT
ncbi:hypothetical protein [uncultured Sunxiuqinia sp.]|uniref:hypothetical protein n=1 Tax=uncultured Sunxiuqinia sp. TaxID=1573825 RepID=UPI0030D96D3E|tara:strand:+ start:10134 stop:10376 length:243 start_codon:yes stop_codon:yes gene_type:complete